MSFTNQTGSGVDLPIAVQWSLIPSISAVLFLIVAMVTFYVIRRRASLRKQINEMNMYDQPGMQHTTHNNEIYEINESAFVLDETKLLGSGAFGKVCLGRLVISEDIYVNVAVKSTKVQSDNALQDLLSEIKLMSYIGSHDNIVRLVGACTKETKSGCFYVFLEYCSLGSLNKYLNKLQPETGVTTILDQGIFENLYQWAIEISLGMEYIASKGLVHADLATRNVLLNCNKTAKIADFGLSRRLYNYSCYVKQHEEPLPWRWMAPESLRKLIFTEKSDVWAYGVTLWELYTLADIPYPGMSWIPNFVTLLEQGVRLPEPTYKYPKMYELMQTCWNINPKDRPCFAEIREKLEVQQTLLALL